MPACPYSLKIRNCPGATYHGQTGAYLSKMPNPALKWEQRMDYNVGADITVHRATIAFDYYNSVTENMLTGGGNIRNLRAQLPKYPPPRVSTP